MYAIFAFLERIGAVDEELAGERRRNQRDELN